jgi:hypothetical protein
MPLCARMIVDGRSNLLPDNKPRSPGCQVLTMRTYNEDDVFAEYLAKNFDRLMSEDERSTLYSAIKRAKSRATGSSGSVSKSSDDESPLFVLTPPEEDPRLIRSRIEDRIKYDWQHGKLMINRCPNCDRIGLTPLAKQCRWCGHDWHNAYWRGKLPPPDTTE